MSQKLAVNHHCIRYNLESMQLETSFKLLTTFKTLSPQERGLVDSAVKPPIYIQHEHDNIDQKFKHYFIVTCFKVQLKAFIA